MERMGRQSASARTDHRPSSRKANAAGYAKRLSKKSAKAKALDTYDFQHSKQKHTRAAVDTALDREEAVAYGAGAGGSSDEDADEDDIGARARSIRARLLGEGDEVDQIASDEDDEIDSDAAFEESDEERFAGFFSDKKRKPSSVPSKQKAGVRGEKRAVRFAIDVDLNEDDNDNENQGAMEDDDQEMSDDDESADQDDEDEDMEDEGAGFIDVLDVLDGRAKPYLASDDDEPEPGIDVQRSTATTTISSNVLDDDQAHGSDGEKDEERNEGQYEDEEREDEPDKYVQPTAIFASDDEDEDPTALTGLNEFISNLDPSHEKRKATDDEQAEVPPARKRRFIEERTEVGPENEFGGSHSGAKLTLEDLLGPLEGQSESLQSLRQATAPLASTKNGPLPAPLPQRTQERLDREAAYEQTREEVDKWKETMQRIKEAEHLSFPLQAQRAPRPSNLELNAKFKPSTELESAVDKLLKAAHLRGEADVAKTEALQMEHLSPEEVAARRAELRRMRELAFRADVKAKRVAKIKSKAYRRLRRKERGKVEVDDEDDEERRMKMEVERARERATLRHKHTGKWAREMKERGETLDDEQRRDVNDMLERSEKLRRRIRGETSGGEESSEGSDAEPGDEAAIRARAFDELKRLDEDEQIGEEAASKLGKGVFGMKFMKDAAVRDARRAQELADDAMTELDGALEEDLGTDDGVESQAAPVQRMGGRISFHPGVEKNIPQELPPVPPSDSDATDSTLTAHSSTVVSTQTPRAPPTAPANPWLVVSPEAGSSKAPRKQAEITVSKHSGAADKSRHKVRKRAQKHEDEVQKAQDDAAVEISTSDFLSIAGPMHAAASVGQNGKRKEQALEEDAGAASRDEEENGELEEQERLLKAKGKRRRGVTAFEQRDLVARAFAGDNVVQAFAEAKELEIQNDAPQEVDTTLAGWGSWGGKGTKHQPPKPHLIKKIAGVDPSARADAGKAHVIISEKRDKKAAKYLVKDLPYPYTSRAQFERSMDTPIGTEWNTRVAFQRATLPRVTKKMGAIISPLDKLR